MGIPLPEIEKLQEFLFMFFDRYEIHIQAFVHFINGKVIIFNPHFHKSILRNIYIYILNIYIYIYKYKYISKNKLGNSKTYFQTNGGWALTKRNFSTFYMLIYQK